MHNRKHSYLSEGHFRATARPHPLNVSTFQGPSLFRGGIKI